MNGFSGFIELEIGGALRPFHFGTYQTSVFCIEKAKALKERATTPAEQDKYKYPIEVGEYNKIFFSKEEYDRRGGMIEGEDLFLLVYSALKAGAKLTKQQFNADPVEVAAWLDEPEWQLAKPIEFLNFFWTHTTEQIKKREKALEILKTSLPVN